MTKKIITTALFIFLFIAVFSFARRNMREDVITSPTVPLIDTLGWEVYRNKEYGFEIKHPTELRARDNYHGVGDFIYKNIYGYDIIPVVDFSSKNIDDYTGGDANGIYVYVHNSQYKFFDAYKNDLENRIRMVLKIDNKDTKLPDDYLFRKETINGTRIIFHKNPLGFIDGTYEMHVELGNGKVLVFRSEGDDNLLDRLYQSFRVFVQER